MKDAKQKQSAFSMRCVDVGRLRVNGDSLRRADSTLLLHKRRIKLAALKRFKIELMYDPVRKNISVLVWRSSIICYLCSVVKKKKGYSKNYTFSSPAILMNLSLQTGSLWRALLPQRNWKGKWIQIGVFYKRKCSGLQNKHFSDILHSTLEKPNGKNLCSPIFPKAVNPKGISE